MCRSWRSRRCAANDFGRVIYDRVLMRWAGWLPSVRGVGPAGRRQVEHEGGLQVGSVLELLEHREAAALVRVEEARADALAAADRLDAARIELSNLVIAVVEQLAMRAAVDIDRFYRRTEPAGAAADVPLMLSIDAKGIVMLPKDLRESTRKNTEVKQADGGNAMKTRLAAREKNCRNPDRPADPDHERTDGPKACNKWLTGSVADTIADVVCATTPHWPAAGRLPSSKAPAATWSTTWTLPEPAGSCRR